MPLEIMTLGVSLCDAGFEVQLIDERTEPDAVGIANVAVQGALFIGISARPGDQVDRSLELFDLLKEHHPGTPIVWGGWFPSTFPDACLKIENLDFVVQGGADTSLVELALRIRDADGDVRGLKGVNARDGKNIVRNPRRPLENLAKTPRIPWALFPVHEYLTADGCINLYTSRGCPGRCRFCGVPSVFPGVWTGYEAERVVDDIETLHGMGGRIFKVLDTDMFPDHERVREICRLLIQRDLNIRWIADVRIKDVIQFDSEMWDLLRRSGCAELETGGESGAEDLLDAMQKECTAGEIYDGVKVIVDHGIAARVNFILGLPNETKNLLNETLRLVHRIGLLGPKAKFQFYRFTPSPATRFGSETWHSKNSRHDGSVPVDVRALNGVPINHDKAPMFWLKKSDEARVKRFYYLHLPLAYYFQDDGRKGIKRWGLRLLMKLARARIRFGFSSLPFESFLCDAFDRPLPRSREHEWLELNEAASAEMPIVE